MKLTCSTWDCLLEHDIHGMQKCYFPQTKHDWDMNSRFFFLKINYIYIFQHIYMCFYNIILWLINAYSTMAIWHWCSLVAHTLCTVWYEIIIKQQLSLQGHWSCVKINSVNKNHILMIAEPQTGAHFTNNFSSLAKIWHFYLKRVFRYIHCPTADQADSIIR